MCYPHGTVSDTGGAMMIKIDVFFIQEAFLVSVTFSPVGAKKEGKRILKHLPKANNVLNILSLINNLEKPIITN